MFKKMALLVCLAVSLLALGGCYAILAGAAGGTGTAIWLSGKLAQEVNVPYERVIDAAKRALKSLSLPVVKETKEPEVFQLRSKYTDGKEVWIDIRKLSDSSSKIEVRVGVISADKAAADKILKRISRYL